MNDKEGRGSTRMNADRQGLNRGLAGGRAAPNRGSGDRPLLYGAVTESVLGAFFDVYNELGGGFLESVYSGAMAVVLEEAGVSFEREPIVAVKFRKRTIGIFRPDFVVAHAVIVELKGARAIEDAHQAQLLNYLRATTLEVGLLLNFGPTPTYKRLVFANTRKTHHSPS